MVEGVSSMETQEQVDEAAAACESPVMLQLHEANHSALTKLRRATYTHVKVTHVLGVLLTFEGARTPYRL